MNVKLYIKDIIRGISLSWKAARLYTLYNLLLSIITSILPLISLWFIKEIIDTITEPTNTSKKQFIYTLIILLIIQLVHAILVQLQKVVQTIQQQMTVDYLSAKVLKKAVSVEYPYYANAEYFSSLHMAQQEVLFRTALLSTGYNQLLQNGISVFFLSVLLLQFNWIYALLIIVAAIPVLVIKWKHAVSTQELEKKNLLSERKANYFSRILTDATHAREVRTFYFGNVFIEKFEALRRLISSGKKRLLSRQNRTETIIRTLEICLTGAIIYNLGMQTFEGLITAGSFILYLQALQKLQSGFNNFLTAFAQLFRQRFFLKNIFSFLNLPERLQKPEASDAFPTKIEKGIEFKNVSFAYPNSNSNVLSSLNMHFKPGKVTAIIGENGCGKSTLVKLLARLHEENDGVITIENKDIKNISKNDYYKNASFLFQEYNQYHFSIADNIALDNEINNQQLLSSAKNAGILELIESQPKGFDTTLGRMFGNDLQLSGGQWQKIAIARMLYRNTRIMILDEPSSNIDPLAEFKILEKLTGEKDGKIIILITHRLHNLKFADHVYVLEDGKINDEGTVDHLLQSSKLFRSMYARQKLEPAAETF